MGKELFFRGSLVIFRHRIFSLYAWLFSVSWLRAYLSIKKAGVDDGEILYQPSVSFGLKRGEVEAAWIFRDIVRVFQQVDDLQVVQVICNRFLRVGSSIDQQGCPEI